MSIGSLVPCWGRKTLEAPRCSFWCLEVRTHGTVSVAFLPELGAWLSFFSLFQQMKTRALQKKQRPLFAIVPSWKVDRQRESSTIAECWSIFEDGCGRPAFAVKQFAVDLEFRYLYTMIYVVFRAGPGQLCQFCMMTLPDLQTILNICLSHVNRCFRILAKKCFLLEYLRQNLHATKQFSNETTVALVENVSFLSCDYFLFFFRRLWQAYKHAGVSKG